MTRNRLNTTETDYHPVLLGWCNIAGLIRITHTIKAAAEDDTLLHYFNSHDRHKCVTSLQTHIEREEYVPFSIDDEH